MGTSKRGKASLLFEDPPLILSAASVVGKKEGELSLIHIWTQLRRRHRRRDLCLSGHHRCVSAAYWSDTHKMSCDPLRDPADPGGNGREPYGPVPFAPVSYTHLIS